jgi:hypothetical protein
LPPIEKHSVLITGDSFQPQNHLNRLLQQSGNRALQRALYRQGGTSAAMEEEAGRGMPLEVKLNRSIQQGAAIQRQGYEEEDNPSIEQGYANSIGTTSNQFNMADTNPYEYWQNQQSGQNESNEPDYDPYEI